MKTDKELIEAICSRDSKKRSEALKHVCGAYFTSIKAYVINNHGDESEAKDIFQDGVTALYLNIQKGAFKEESKIKTYLYGICKNLWRQRLRELESEKKKMQEAQVFAMPEDDPSAINVDLLKANFEQLKEDCKKVLLSSYFECKSIRQIRDEMGFESDQSAKNKKYKCLQYLMRIVKKNRLNKDMFYHES